MKLTHVDPVALLSWSGRVTRSRELAAWLGLPEDAVESFVERMELSWVRQQAFEVTQAHTQVERPATAPKLSRRMPRARASVA